MRFNLAYLIAFFISAAVLVNTGYLHFSGIPWYGHLILGIVDIGVPVVFFTLAHRIPLIAKK